MARSLSLGILLLVLSSGCAIVARDHYYTMTAENARTLQTIGNDNPYQIGNSEGDILILNDADIDIEVASENRGSTLVSIGPMIVVVPLPVIPVFPITMLLPPYFDDKEITIVLNIKELKNKILTIDPALFQLSVLNENMRLSPVKFDSTERAIKGTPVVDLYTREIKIQLTYNLGKDEGKNFILELKGIRVNGQHKTFSPIAFREAYVWFWGFGP